MSKLTKLCGKLKEEVEIGDGEDKVIITLRPPMIEDLSELTPLFNNKTEDGLSAEQLIKVTGVLKNQLKADDPTASDEEINEIIVVNLSKLIEGLGKILEASFKVDDSKKVDDKTQPSVQ